MGDYDDLDEFFDAAHQWHDVQGGKPATGAKPRDRHTGRFKPADGTPADPRQEMLNDYVTSLTGADAEGQLAAAFEEGIESGDIHVSDVVLGLLDDPEVPDGFRYDVGRLLTEKPHISKMIARQPARMQLGALVAAVENANAAAANPPPPVAGPEYRAPLNGSAHEAREPNLAQLASFGNMRAYRAYRESQGYGQAPRRV